MKIKNIAILQGSKTTTKDGTVSYQPEFADKKDSKGEISRIALSAELRTDVNFNQGILKFKLKAADKDTGVLVIWEAEDEHLHLAGLSKSTETFRLKDSRRKIDITNGGISQFKSNEEIRVRIEIFGSEMRLFVNDILYCEIDSTPVKTPLSFRITSAGKVTLYDIEVETVRPKLFVVMQFTEDFNKLYSDVIIPISEELGLEVIRADEFYSSTPILNDIIRSIKESSIIIADITPDNPNVFYEIGYAHAVQKPTILICDKKREKLPFDVSSFRTLFYENTIAGKAKIESSLRKYLENILEEGT